MNITIKTDRDWEKIKELFENGDARTIQLGKDALLASGYKVRKHAVDRAPYKTGTLQRDITVEVVGHTVHDLEAHIGGNLPYMPVHEYGGAWTFTRDVVFGRKVEPFTYTAFYKEREFLRKGLEDAEGEIQTIFDTTFARILEPA